MDQLVYVETSVPSFYFDTRPEHTMRAMRQWTRDWWSLPRIEKEFVVSPVVWDELNDAQRVNALLGLRMPALVTPQQLLAQRI